MGLGAARRAHEAHDGEGRERGAAQDNGEGQQLAAVGTGTAGGSRQACNEGHDHGKARHQQRGKLAPSVVEPQQFGRTRPHGLRCPGHCRGHVSVDEPRTEREDGKLKAREAAACAANHQGLWGPASPLARVGGTQGAVGSGVVGTE